MAQKDEKVRSDLIYDTFGQMMSGYQMKKQKLKELGKLSRPTALLVSDLEKAKGELISDIDHKKIDALILEAKKEGFHDFYASEDSEGDTKDAYELVMALRSFNKDCTNLVALWATEGKYDAEKGDEDDLV